MRESHKVSGEMIHCLMILAMAASYDPDPDQAFGIRLPFDLKTCALDLEAWERWLLWDPVLFHDSRLSRLKELKGCFIDCGNLDQYHLQFGARQFHLRLENCGVSHTYEEFSDNHSGIDYRLEKSLPFLSIIDTRAGLSPGTAVATRC